MFDPRREITPAPQAPSAPTPKSRPLDILIAHIEGLTGDMNEMGGRINAIIERLVGSSPAPEAPKELPPAPGILLHAESALASSLREGARLSKLISDLDKLI